MKGLFKNKLATALIVVATIILASVAVFTAMRLYQLRQSPVSPAVPESEPAASQTPTTNACGTLAFSLSTPSLTPTGTLTVTATPTGTPSVTPTSSLTPTASLSPTQPPRGGPSNTPTNTPTTTTALTSTPSSVLTVTPTSSDDLPEAGFGLPTTLALVFGSLSLLFALSIAL